MFVLQISNTRNTLQQSPIKYVFDHLGKFRYTFNTRDFASCFETNLSIQAWKKCKGKSDLILSDWQDPLEHLSGDDPQVVEILKTQYLDPPSDLPYNLSTLNESQGSHMFTWPWIRSRLDLLFGGEPKGFFIEAGALDGQYLSNTLWLERKRNWTGLLIEPDRNSYGALRQKHRRAWSSNTCLTADNYPKKATFVSVTPKFEASISAWAFRGHSHEFKKDVKQTGITKYEDMKNSTVQCFPLISYLKALNVSQIDFLSLDVQGSEANIILTILKTKGINVRVIATEDESYKIDDNFADELFDNGYMVFDYKIDLIFVKQDDPLLKKKHVKQFLRTRKIKNEARFIYIED
ncbi:hypothetical protein SK128_013960 [Halocaridina rubra]|uniref:Methyltransferase FkbM domain-containing protein n=1 Tax=Halocaridina rubra TaxID=373956 RepID=A0AAN9ADR9_HALRR